MNPRVRILDTCNHIVTAEVHLSGHRYEFTYDGNTHVVDTIERFHTNTKQREVHRALPPQSKDYQRTKRAIQALLLEHIKINPFHRR